MDLVGCQNPLFSCQRALVRIASDTLSDLGNCGLALASESMKINNQLAIYTPLSYSDNAPKLG